MTEPGIENKLPIREAPAQCGGCDMPNDEATRNLVREQLGRIVQSAVFIQSTRLSRFLRFVVESTLRDRAAVLKEYVIGTEVYDRKPPYHPSQDSIVRTEAIRLRRKLKTYYESEGKSDPMLICFRPGSYVPEFRHGKISSTSGYCGRVLTPTRPVGAPGILIAVLPFDSLPDDPLAAECARWITDDLSHKFMHKEECRVMTIEPQPFPACEENAVVLPQRLGVHLVFHGSVRQEKRGLCVTSRVTGSDGFLLWSQQFRTEVAGDEVAGITAKIASTLISRTNPRSSGASDSKESLSSLSPQLMAAESRMHEGSGADLHTALARFQAIIVESPESSRAHCGIAQCHYEIAMGGTVTAADEIYRAKSASLQALSLDPTISAAHSCLANVLAVASNRDAASKAFAQALDFGPDPFTYRHFALFLTALGEFDEASHYMTKAQDIDPFSSLQKIALMKYLYLSRQYEETIRQCAGALAYGPIPLEAQMYSALSHIQLGQFDDAREWAYSARRSAPRLPGVTASLAEILAGSGDNALAWDFANKYRLRSDGSPISRCRQASLAVALGDIENASTLLAAAREDQEPELLWVGVDPRFELIRESSAPTQQPKTRTTAHYIEVRKLEIGVSTDSHSLNS